jgi:hypothetical protein
MIQMHAIITTVNARYANPTSMTVRTGRHPAGIGIIVALGRSPSKDR